MLVIRRGALALRPLMATRYEYCLFTSLIPTPVLIIDHANTRNHSDAYALWLPKAETGSN